MARAVVVIAGMKRKEIVLRGAVDHQVEGIDGDRPGLLRHTNDARLRTALEPVLLLIERRLGHELGRRLGKHHHIEPGVERHLVLRSLSVGLELSARDFDGELVFSVHRSHIDRSDRHVVEHNPFEEVGDQLLVFRSGNRAQLVYQIA